MSFFCLQILFKKIKYGSQKGFTLIELLVVIIIVSVLSGLALPSMLNQANKARQSVAKSQIGSVNRAQQVYRLESPVFSNSMNYLQIGIPLATDSYTYSFGTTDSILAEFRATPTNTTLSAITGCTNANIVLGSLATTSVTLEEQPASGSGSIATPPSC